LQYHALLATTKKIYPFSTNKKQRKQIFTILEHSVKNITEESATAIMILETGKAELRNLNFKHHTFCNLGNSIHM